MSLNKTLDRFFDEIRREAKRNPDFADRLDAVLRGHASRRDVDAALIEEVSADRSSGVAPVETPPPSSPKSGRKPASAASPQKQAPVLDLNPVGLYQREGADALAAALEGKDREALVALVAEHNLDPGGEAEELDRDALAVHIMAQAKRRAERDNKLFDY
ncbi:MAG TPA: hypothetical protein VG943_04780 [Caulobacterales bacterium]|nr:hypothetical protein [Caulobacterales bacterium]